MAHASDANSADSASGAGVQDVRREFERDRLEEAQAGHDPHKLFEAWLSDALNASIRDATAFVLATVSPQGQPSSRVLLLKGHAPAGYTFYTNYGSRKGTELAQNPRGAMLFFWAELERQIRIEGEIEKISREESLTYFQSRPRGSQLGAHASPQSSVLRDREELEASLRSVEERYGKGEGAGDSPVPLPDDWGGYVLRPQLLEFWQGRSSRLHDRLVFTKDGDESWQRNRLAP